MGYVLDVALPEHWNLRWWASKVIMFWWWLCFQGYCVQVSKLTPGHPKTHVLVMVCLGFTLSMHWDPWQVVLKQAMHLWLVIKIMLRQIKHITYSVCLAQNRHLCMLQTCEFVAPILSFDSRMAYMDLVAFHHKDVLQFFTLIGGHVILRILSSIVWGFLKNEMAASF